MGCIFSAARPSLTVAGSVWSKVRVVPYGVLGTQLATDSPRSERRVGVAPDGETLVVDPCSARIVRRGRPSEAGGAAGAIYAFLGIDGDATFPADVVAAIAREGDVAYHRYGYPVSRHVVHAVGVDFRDRPSCSRAEAVAALARVYAAILRLAARIGKRTIRLAPLSAGIYAGTLADEMPDLTAAALFEAVSAAAAGRRGDDPGDRDDGDARELRAYAEQLHAVELCVYDAREVAAFSAAVADVAKRRRADLVLRRSELPS